MNENHERTKSASIKRRQKAKTESSIRNSNLNLHWGALAENLEIIRRRTKSPETLRLVERRSEMCRAGTRRQKFDMNAQRQIWVPSRPNKRSREEIAEIDGEFLTRANRSGGGYQPLEERVEEEQEYQQPETIQDIEQENEGETQVVRGDNFPIVDLKSYNTDGKEIQFIHINQVFEKKNTEATIKKAEFNFMLDLKTLMQNLQQTPNSTGYGMH